MKPDIRRLTAAVAFLGAAGLDPAAAQGIPSFYGPPQTWHTLDRPLRVKTAPNGKDVPGFYIAEGSCVSSVKGAVEDGHTEIMARGDGGRMLSGFVAAADLLYSRDRPGSGVCSANIVEVPAGTALPPASGKPPEPPRAPPVRTAPPGIASFQTVLGDVNLRDKAKLEYPPFLRIQSGSCVQQHHTNAEENGFYKVTVTDRVTGRLHKGWVRKQDTQPAVRTMREQNPTCDGITLPPNNKLPPAHFSPQPED